MPTNKLMKRLSLYLFLIFFTLHNPSRADNIRDFQIEGMSIYDSAFDHLTEEKLEVLEKYVYENKKFIAVVVYPEDISKKSFEIYDAIQLVYNIDSKKIISLEAFILYRNNIEDCYPKKDEISLELKNFFGNTVKVWNQDDVEFGGDKSGKSKFSATNLDFTEGGGARVICYDMDKEIQKIYNWSDKLTVVINSKEFDKYISEN